MNPSNVESLSKDQIFEMVEDAMNIKRSLISITKKLEASYETSVENPLDLQATNLHFIPRRIRVEYDKFCNADLHKVGVDVIIRTYLEWFRELELIVTLNKSILPYSSVMRDECFDILNKLTKIMLVIEEIDNFLSQDNNVSN